MALPHSFEVTEPLPSVSIDMNSFFSSAFPSSLSNASTNDFIAAAVPAATSFFAGLCSSR